MKIAALALAGCVCLSGAAHAQLGASIESMSYPNTMESGKLYPVSVTVRNTGNLAWTSGSLESGQLVRLGMVGDSLAYGRNRANMHRARVEPGDSHTFHFEVAGPRTDSGRQIAVPFTWRMLQERVTWFGSVTPSGSDAYHVTVASKPALAPSTLIPLSKPAVVARADEFSFANFRGANVVHKRYAANGNSHTGWFHSLADTRTVLDAARRMELNMIRFPVVIPPSGAAFDSREWGGDTSAAALAKVIAKTRMLMDEAAARGMKVVLTLDGYTLYDEGPCFWKKSFRDVEGNARQLVAAIHHHPALFAWDLLNEPLHNASQVWRGQTMSCLESAPGVASPQRYRSVVNAVRAMYNLVREHDVLDHYTTVGEGHLAYMDYWTEVASFHSFHWYYNVAVAPDSTAPATKPAVMKNLLEASIVQLRKLPQRPVVISEYGQQFSSQAPERQANWYQAYLQGLKANRAGGALWSLSTFNEYTIAPSGARLECIVRGMQRSDQPACG